MMVNEFFKFMREREGIRLAKLAGMPREEWTTDPILARYKFTNVKRSHDWTTKTLLEKFYTEHVRGVERPTELLVNCTIARFFGLAETVLEIGWCDGGIEHTVGRIQEVVRARYGRGDAVFTGAYIVPNCGDTRPKHEIVIDVVRDVQQIGREDWFHEQMTFQSFIRLLKQVKGFGSFMGKEVILDFVAASGWRPSDWDTWTPIGPGACRGASRVKNDTSDPPGSLFPELKEKAALEVVKILYGSYSADRRTEMFALWPKDWVALDLCDIQFQLCEWDKYQRAVRDGGRPKARYVPRA